jgi:mannose-6-phosphate isomerase-like protein (cupin superfamily)
MVPFKLKKVEKEWGHEIWLANNKDEDYCGKILFIKKNKSTSMHYHLSKHETMYVLEGSLMIDGLADRHSQSYKFSMLVGEGESVEIERGRPHKLIADEQDTTIIEVSTFHKDEDSYRLWK